MTYCSGIWYKTAVLAGAVIVSASVFAAETVIDGSWTIVQRDYPTDCRGLTIGARLVADALADVLAEASGVKATVVSEKKTPKGPGKRIFLGDEFAERAGLMPADFGNYDWGMAEKDGDLYFFGHDRTGSNPVNARGCVNLSAIAAIQFMRQQVGVLFLMPGKTGREVPRIGKLSVPAGFFRRGTVKVPFQAGRVFDYPYELANAIYGQGAFHTFGGHTYPVACPRKKYLDSHPEYFARDKQGKVIMAASDGCQAYCISNPDFRKLVCDELIRRFDAGAEVCELGQNDGPAGLCRCQACHDLYGTGDDWCEKLWCFHRGIAEDVLRDRSGKIVQIICYDDTLNPPKTFKTFPENVMIEMCSYSEEALARWDGYVVPHGFTYYLYNWSWYPVLGFTPKCSIASLVDQVTRFYKYGLKGVYRCGYGEMFGMEGPAYWIFNHLVEDPKTDVPAALTTYYRGAFGPAADQMRRFYEDLEEPLSAVKKRSAIKAAGLVESVINRRKTADPVSMLALIYTPERLARMEAALTAAQQTDGLSPKQVRRLQLVRTEWNYVRNLGAIAWRYDRFRAHPTAEGRDGVIKLLRERSEIVERLFPNGKIRGVKDWPELALFGNPPLDHFKVNGRLFAPIREPLAWDIEKMVKYRIVPGLLMTPEERRKELDAAGLKPLVGFAPPKGSLSMGATFDAYPDGTGFKFGQGTNTHVQVRANIGAKEGLLPGKTYLVSWLCRWEHVNAPRSNFGFYFSAGYEELGEGRRKRVQEPADPLHYGTSDGWVRESVVMTVCGKPGFASDFVFGFWGGRDGVAEVRDVVIEAVEE